ncbi:hypothetical protein SAMN02745866_03589 [Alteromonadaceae bacterium Bs31]|nr:hypothetical protein SAMN02745866_03589 [Alteromonadaceae bacterium Bs31]
MEQEHIYQTPKSDLSPEQAHAKAFKLYKISGIGVATFFGTMIAGAYIASRNCNALGRPQQGKIILLFSTLFTIALMTASFFIPEDIEVPNIVFTIVPLVIMVQMSKKWFLEEIVAHEDAAGKMYSNWRAFSISLLFLLGLFTIAVGAAFLFFE